MAFESFVYCESAPSALIAQPLNTASNAVFLVLALWARRRFGRGLHIYGLVAIGVASAAWHATGLLALLWLDIAAIAVFCVAYAVDWARVAKFKAAYALRVAAVGLAASFVSAALFQPVAPLLSGAFAPFWLALTIGAVSRRTPSASRRVCGLSALAMALAIIAREGDLAACAAFPGGTHFFWHIGAGLSLIAPLTVLCVVRRKRSDANGRWMPPGPQDE